MAKATETYSNWAERQTWVAQYEAQGWRMLHDDFHPNWKRGDEPHGTLTFTDEPSPVAPSEPPRSTHFARIDSFHPAELKPLRVVRTWEGNDYTYDCFVTETLKDQYLAGDVAVGDYVLVHFDDSDRKVAMLKIFKSW